jgi:hypothetical protein
VTRDRFVDWYMSPHFTPEFAAVQAIGRLNLTRLATGRGARHHVFFPMIFPRCRECSESVDKSGQRGGRQQEGSRKAAGRQEPPAPSLLPPSSFVAISHHGGRPDVPSLVAQARPSIQYPARLTPAQTLSHSPPEIKHSTASSRPLPPAPHGEWQDSAFGNEGIDLAQPARRSREPSRASACYVCGVSFRSALDAAHSRVQSRALLSA